MGPKLCENEVKKVAFSCLQIVNKTKPFHPIFHNLGSTFSSIPVSQTRWHHMHWILPIPPCVRGGPFLVVPSSYASCTTPPALLFEVGRFSVEALSLHSPSPSPVTHLLSDPALAQAQAQQNITVGRSDEYSTFPWIRRKRDLGCGGRLKGGPQVA